MPRTSQGSHVPQELPRQLRQQIARVIFQVSIKMQSEIEFPCNIHMSDLLADFDSIDTTGTRFLCLQLSLQQKLQLSWCFEPRRPHRVISGPPQPPPPPPPIPPPPTPLPPPPPTTITIIIIIIPGVGKNVRGPYVKELSKLQQTGTQIRVRVWKRKCKTACLLYYLLRCHRSSKSPTRHLCLITDKISDVAMTTHVCGFECTHHTPNSADLVPSDCHMFLNLKKQLAGVHYTTNDTILLQRHI